MLTSIMLAVFILAISQNMALAKQEIGNGINVMNPNTHDSLNSINIPKASNMPNIFGIPGLSNLTSNLSANAIYDFSNKSIVLLPNLSVNIIVIQNMTTINNNFVPPLDVIARSHPDQMATNKKTINYTNHYSQKGIP